MNRWLVCVSSMALGGCFLGACAPSRTYVLDAPAYTAGTSLASSSVSVREAPGDSGADPKLLSEFKSSLRKHLEEEPGIAVSDDAPVTLLYRFVLHTDGNAPVRVGSGLLNLLGSPFYGLGDGAVGVDVTYLDRAGQPIGRIVADGAIAGMFGSWRDAVDMAAQNVAMYTRMNYVKPGREEKGSSADGGDEGPRAVLIGSEEGTR